MKGARSQITRGLLLLALFGAFPLLAQQTSPLAEAKAVEATPPLLEFDVVSVKEFIRNGNVFSMWSHWNPSGLTAMHQTLRGLICIAWGASDYQVSGGPSWMDNAYFQIQAKMDDATAAKMKLLSFDQKQAMRKRMLQAVLADRFNLTLRHETRPFPGYALVVAKGGPKLHEASTGESSGPGAKSSDVAPKSRGGMAMNWENGGLVLTTEGYSIDSLSTQLTGMVHGKVRNETGLKGVYDIKLRFAEERGLSADPGSSANAPDALPNLFDALQEQLGLKLEPRKEADDALIVEHVEKPTEN